MKKIFVVLMMVVCGIVHAQQRTSFEGNPKWQSNQYVWYYNQSSSPNYTSRGSYVNFTKSIINYLNLIEQECNIDFKYAGTTTNLNAKDGTNVLSWGSISSSGLEKHYRDGSSIIEADVVLTTNEMFYLRDALALIKHEFFHAIGFAHTSETESAMLYPYPSASWMYYNYEYDIKECQRIYGVRSHRTKFTPQIAYSGSTVDLTVQVTADDIDLGTTRNVYVLAVFQGMLFEQTTSGWQQVNDTNNLTPYKTIDSIEKTTNVKVLNDFNYTWLTGTGTQVYVGFANNTSDLMKFDQYKMVIEF